MKVSAIICEYNPFHNGHKYQIDTARDITGCDSVVGLMSGNFVQRGDFAVFPKEIRARACIEGGVDLVLENPAYLTLRSAERYAYSAVNILNSLGVVDFLVFGAETDNLDKLYQIARLLCDESEEFKKILSENMAKGLPFAAAREKATENILGEEVSKLLSTPNNLLGVEYLKALIKLKSDIKPVLIQRKSVEHNADAPVGEFASATNIRQLLEKGEDVSPYIPNEAAKVYENPFNKDVAEKAILSALTLMSVEDIKSIPDVSEGLENKIKAEALNAETLDDLIAKVKSKRYAYSRIKRALLCGYLGIGKDDGDAQYIKILDFNENGQKVLNAAKKAATLPLAKNASAILKNQTAMEQWKKELYRDKVYHMFYKG